MAKYEQKLRGNFDELLNWLDNDIMKGSASVSYEDGSDIDIERTKMAVRVYERFSFAGGNRVSMNITLLGVGEELFVTAITSGGSQAIFHKINTIGEENFLELFRESIEKYLRQYP